MALVLNGPGPTTILNTTSTAFGEWYRVHPRLSNLTVQVVHTGTSIGATVVSQWQVQGSNDGVNPMQTTAGSSIDALGTGTFNGGSPQSAGIGITAGWAFIRGYLTSAPTTGTVTMKVHGQMRS